MRPGPDSPSVAARLVLAVAILPLGIPARAVLAQGGPGAERYEVTITPPKRPGSEPGVAAGTATAAPQASGTVKGDRPAADHVLGATEAGSAEPGTAAAGAERQPQAKAGAVPAAVPATVDPDLPRRSLQVGAFRQRSLATAMQGKLESAFPDVEVVEVQSGGTPLFRVHVGRLPKGPALSRLKNRLADAGYPSFDVPAPPPGAAD